MNTYIVASLALETRKGMHDITYDEIRKQLIGDGQIPEF